jgi:hypothetical protein
MLTITNKDIERWWNMLAELYPCTEQQKKNEGMEQSANNHKELVSLFRTIAEILGDKFPEVTIDDVRYTAQMQGIVINPKDNNAWMGSIFKGKKWHWNGKMKVSTHCGSHGRLIKVWEHRRQSDSCWRENFIGCT